MESNQEQIKKKADSFFSVDKKEDLAEFVVNMKQKKEKIEAPNITFEDDDGADPHVREPGTEPSGEDKWESDDKILEHFNYSDAERQTAEFLLIQIDKILGFVFSMVGGHDSDRYRRRITKPMGDDYEVDIFAAMMKKYQMKLSVEWMFASAMLIGYGPMLNKAIKDRKDAKRLKDEFGKPKF